MRIARVDCPVLYLEVAVFIFLLANPAFNFLTVIYGGTPSASLFVIVADGDCWGWRSLSAETCHSGSISGSHDARRCGAARSAAANVTFIDFACGWLRAARFLSRSRRLPTAWTWYFLINNKEWNRYLRTCIWWCNPRKGLLDILEATAPTSKTHRIRNINMNAAELCSEDRLRAQDLPNIMYRSEVLQFGIYC